MKYTIRLRAAACVIALALSGCAAFSAGGMSATTARYRHAARQGRESGKGLAVYTISPSEFPQGSSFAAIRDANPTSEGAQLLRDEVLTDVTIAKTAQERGLPNAIGFAVSWAGQTQRFIMFYERPPRSIVLQRSSMDVQWASLSQLAESTISGEIPAVPRSIQRIGLNKEPMPPQWPVTIPSDMRDAFEVPVAPAEPPAQVDGHDYATVADDLKTRLPQSTDEQSRQRANAALRRLEPAANLTGLNWRVIVFTGAGPMGFGVPDGSLFVSDGLVQILDDDELAAILAHVMGHERHQHARACAKRRNIMVAVMLVGGAFSLAGTGIGFFLIPTGSYVGLIADPEFGYSDQHELEANSAAAELLTAAKLPPDVLFDVMMKLSAQGQPGTLAYSQMHHLPVARAQYGLMLDAGMIAAR